MKHDRTRVSRRALFTGRPVLFAAVLLAVSFVAASAQGCWGGADETPDTTVAMVSDATTIAPAAPETTTPTVAKTTTTTLSLHDRIQQEQEAQEAQSAAEDATTTTSTTVLIVVEQGKTLVMVDGTRLTSDEVKAANSYASFVHDAQQEQERLSAQFDSFMSQAGNWKKSDYSKFRSMISAQYALLSRLAGKTAPPIYQESHQKRTKAAELFAQAWQQIYEGDPGSNPIKDETAVNEGYNVHGEGLQSWHQAANQSTLIDALISDGRWE